MKRLFFILTLLALSIFSMVSVYADGYRGWLTDRNGHWWYQLEDGSRYKGWLDYKGTWYYLDSEGYMVWSQWVGNYFLDDHGRMMEDKITYDGYVVGEDGAWIPGIRADKNNGTFVFYKVNLNKGFGIGRIEDEDKEVSRISIQSPLYEYNEVTYMGNFIGDIHREWKYNMTNATKYQIQKGFAEWRDVDKAEFISNLRKDYGGIIVFTAENGELKEIKLKIE